MKQFFLLLLLWVNIVYVHANHIIDQIDWETFLSRHDLVWDKTPDSYFNAPFLGNGLLGGNALSAIWKYVATGYR